jgi:acyl carrier protein
MVAFLEKEYSIKFPDDDLMSGKLLSVDSICAAIRAKIAQRA